MRRPSAVALLLAAAGALVGCGADGPEPPPGYVTFRGEDVEFRHPPGWVVERGARNPDGPESTVLLRPRGSNPDQPGPQIRMEVRRLEKGLGTVAASMRSELESSRDLEAEVPGASRRTGFAGAYPGGSPRVAVMLAARGDRLVLLTAGGPRGTKGLDEEAVAASLRLR